MWKLELKKGNGAERKQKEDMMLQKECKEEIMNPMNIGKVCEKKEGNFHMRNFIRDCWRRHEAGEINKGEMSGEK